MLLYRISSRYLLRHPWVLALAILGVALGVAVVVAIDLANSGARKAFELSSDAVSGRTTHQVRAASGPLDEAVYVDLRVRHGLRRAAPVVETYVRALSCDGRLLRMLGIDPIVDGSVRSITGGRDYSLERMMTQRSGILEEGTAARCGVDAGDTLSVSVDGVEHSVTLAGTLKPSDERSRTAVESILIVDVATAQELMGWSGRLSRVDLVLPPEEAASERIRSLLPAGTVLEPSESRTETLAQMTRAFDVNLRALSLLALVVGMFLIYNSITFSVVQRRPLIGRLRAIGMTRSQIFALILGEAAVMGMIGTVVGLGLGVLLATGLLDLVTRTINDLYYVLTVRRLQIESWTLIKGLGIGIGVTTLAALRPAWEATVVPVTVVLQRSSIEETTHRYAYRFGLLSLAVLGAAAVVLLSARTSLVWSYVGLLLVIAGFVMAAPVGVLAVSRIVRPLFSTLFGVVGRMASNAVGASLSRTGIAIAALMVAVAATIGVGVMIGSFRSTVSDWLGYSLEADVYIRPPNLVARRGDARMSPQVLERIRETPGILESYTVSHGPLRSEKGVVDAVVIEPGRRTPDTFKLTGKRLRDAAGTWALMEAEAAVLVSEPFSFRYDVEAGDTLVFESTAGAAPFLVAGTYLDYGSDLGAVLFARSTHQSYFEYLGVAGIALYLDPSADADATIRDIERRTRGLQDLAVQSNRDLRAASLEIFDRTFVVTGVLRFLAVFVAFVGVLSALMALQLEKTKELAVLRATGATPGQIWGFVTLETGIMGLTAGLLSIPLGLVLAGLLVFVINKRSFGWTLQFEPSIGILLGAIALSVVAALLAGLYPAWRMSRTHPSEALRRE